MPIPEPGIYRPSSLTKQQQQENLAACYGVPTMEALSPTEIERLRSIVQNYDSQHKPVKIYDLNNPPKTPYTYQKFPMMVYDHENSRPGHIAEVPERVKGILYKQGDHVPAHVRTLIVKSEHELSAALASGWSERAPEFRDEPSDALSAAYAAEVGQIEQKLEEHRRGPGRPRKEIAA